MADGRARHPQHDLELVAAWAAGEAAGADLERAERLLDACDLCVGVGRDLRTITLALQELPAVDAMTTLPAAPRDFRLTPEQAARLRPTPGVALGGSPVIRWTDRLAAAVAAFGRPVGASLAALGLVGVLVGAASVGFLGAGGASLSAPTSASSAPMAADNLATAAPAQGEGGAAGIVPGATKSGSDSTELGPAASGAARGSAGGPLSTTAGAAASVAPNQQAGSTPAAPVPSPAAWLLVVSLAALVGGVGLVLVATRRG